MKVLNLDELAVVTKTVTLKGKTHDVKEMSVDDFVFANAESKRLAKLKEADATVGDLTEEQMTTMVGLLDRVIPTIGNAELRKLSFQQLDALTGFVNGVLEEEAQKAPGAADQSATEGDAEKK
jgi:phage FluMu protein gp41